jgi:hypothetical protein
VGFITSWYSSEPRTGDLPAQVEVPAGLFREESIAMIFHPQPPATHVVPWQRSTYGRKKFQRGLSGEEMEAKLQMTWNGLDCRQGSWVTARNMTIFHIRKHQGRPVESPLRQPVSKHWWRGQLVEEV